MSDRRLSGLLWGVSLGLMLLAIFLASILPSNIIEVNISPIYGTALMVSFVGMFWGLWRE